MKELLMFFLLQQPVQPPGGAISGRLLHSDGVPVSRTMIVARAVQSAQEEGQGRSFYARTDETGTFRFRNVRPGTYRIVAGDYYYPGVKTETSGVVVTLAAENSQVAGLDFLLPVEESRFQIGGHLIVPPNRPLPPEQRTIELYGGNPSRVTSTVAGPDGSFRFTHLGSGSYSLSTTIPGSEDVPVEIVDRDLDSVTLKVPRSVMLSGSVVVEGRAARPQFALRFSRRGTSFAVNVPVRQDGSFAAQLLEGEYRVQVRNVPAGYYLKTLAAGTVNLLAQPLKIGAEVSAIPVTATVGLSPGVRVGGRVTVLGQQSDSAVGRRIALSNAVTGISAEAPMAADGSFSLEGVLPGTYAARVSLSPIVSSAPVSVVIPATDVKDFDVQVPGLQEVVGRVAVDGNGPPPQFSLVLVRGEDVSFGSEPREKLPVVSVSTLEGAAEAGAAQVLRVDVNPLPDGSFRMMLPEGDYRVVTTSDGRRQGPIPAPYFIRSIDFGTARLMSEPMHVSGDEPAELHIGFGTTDPDPWVKISGHVMGAVPAQGPFRVALECVLCQVATTETFLDANGAFEFPFALKKSRYRVRLAPDNPAASSAQVNVEQKDVEDVELRVAPQREVTVHATVEDGGATPGFVLALAVPCESYCGSSLNVIVKPGPDGRAKVKLPADERRVDISGLPFGYVVKSLVYGSRDLMASRLHTVTLDGSESTELQVVFSIDPDVQTGSLRGHIRGLDPTVDPVQLVLNGVAAVSSFETSVNADGSFAFSKIPQGTYAATLRGSSRSARLNPSSIVVTGMDLVGVNLESPRSFEPLEPVTPNLASGTLITELGNANTATASENAAVANLRTINTALVTFLVASGGQYGTIPQLIDAGLLDSTFTGTRSGFTFSILAKGPDYVATAVPTSKSSARLGFYSYPDGVVRYSLSEFLAPAGQNGSPVQ